MDHFKLCFFVTFDEKNIPVDFDCLGLYPKNRQFIDTSFMYYINGIRNEVKTNSFFPDLRVCRYEILDSPLIRSQFWECDRDTRRFIKFIDESLPQPVYDFSLRKYDALIDAWDGKSIIDNLDDFKYYMDPATYMDKQTKEKMGLSLQYWQEVDQSRDQHLNAIETRQGILLFPRSDMIDKRQKSVFQYIANNYFTREAQQFGYLREYTIYSPSQEQQVYAEQSNYMFSPRDMEFIPEKATWYRPMQSPKEKTGGCQYDILLQYDAFRHFTEDYNLYVDGYNRTIGDLIYIAEYGTPFGFQTDIKYHDFTYRELFKELDDALAKVPTKTPANDRLFYEIQNKQKELARDILRTDYKIALPVSSTPKTKSTIKIVKRRSMLH